MEGSRTFDLGVGLVTGTLCLALAVPILWWQLPAQRRSFFGSAVDPHQRLQLGYGIFCMAMACTNVGCRAIPHGQSRLRPPDVFPDNVGARRRPRPARALVARAPGARASRSYRIVRLTQGALT